MFTITTSLLASLSPTDRDRLSLLFRTRADAVSMASLREEDPLETLAWLEQPHIKPWHQAIQKAHREHEATEVHLSLARALKDITRILDLEADSTLRIRAVSAIIRLANAIHRSHPAAAKSASTRPAASAVNQNPTTNPATPNSTAHQPHAPAPASPMPPMAPLPPIPKELHAANERALDALAALDLHIDRRARLNQHLKEANAPVGSDPIQPLAGAVGMSPEKNGGAAKSHTAANDHAIAHRPSPSAHFALKLQRPAPPQRPPAPHAAPAQPQSPQGPAAHSRPGPGRQCQPHTISPSFAEIPRHSPPALLAWPVPEPTQSWPLTPAIVLEDLSFERLRGIARLFRLGVAPDATWQEVRGQLLLEPAAHAIALLHLLSRKELGDVCRHVNITDEGPTQDVLARLLPLCQPGPTR